MIRRFRSEDGVGVPLAISVLTIVLLVSAWAWTTADHGHRASERDRAGKRAMAAADAGVQAAATRLGVAPTIGDASCLRSDTGAAAPVAGECPMPATATALGDGASFSYVATQRVGAGSTCAGESVVSGEFVRCVTATGVVGAITRRVQARLEAQTIPHPVGVVATSRIDLNNGVEFATCPGDPLPVLGSNGTFYMNNSIRLTDSICGSGRTWSLSHPPGATTTYVQGVVPTPAPVVPLTDPWSLPRVNPWPLADSNASIPSSTGVTWIPAARTLTVAQGTLTLQAGTYVFCGITLGNQGKLALAPGAAVKIYIDSPERPGSTCAVGTGYLRTQNSNGINWPGGEVKDAAAAEAAKNLHVYVYGNNALETATPSYCGDQQAWGAVTMCNSAGMAGTIYAPRSRVYLGNSISYVGAVAADRAYLNNTVKFRFPPGLDRGLSTEYGQTHWTECSPARPVAADPESGCA